MSSTHSNSPVPVVGTVDNSSSNIDGLVLISAARSQTGGPNSDGVYTSGEIYNPNVPGARIFIDITSSNTGTVAVKVQVQDPVSDKWVDITGGTTIALTSTPQTRTLTIHPGLTPATGTATTNTDVANVLDCKWRIVATVATAAVTFSVGATHLM